MIRSAGGTYSWIAGPTQRPSFGPHDNGAVEGATDDLEEEIAALLAQAPVRQDRLRVMSMVENA